MSKVKWLDRELITAPVYYCLCTTEEQYLAEVKKLKVPYPEKWIKGTSNATTHFMDGEDGKTCCIVCMPIQTNRSFIEQEGLLVHEAVHVYQEICSDMGEKSPGHEFEAYAIQRLSMNLIHQFHIELNRLKPAVRKEIQKVSESRLK